MITFNGVDGSTVRVIVEHYPERPIPARKVERFSVPGRSGDVVVAEEAWENVRQRYDIYLSAEALGLPEAARRAAAWLMQPGYRRLTDEYDPGTYRMAAFWGPLDLENVLNQFGRATIEFDCWPQRFLLSGDEPEEYNAAATITNPTGYPAEPLIVVHGSGNGTLAVTAADGTEFAVQMSDCDDVVLDCAEKFAYRDATPMDNAIITARFPQLRAGDSEIFWSGGITGVTVTPRWFWL